MAGNATVLIKRGEIIPPTRNVGIRVGDQVYVPSLPIDPSHAAALAGCFDAHTQALINMDRFFATAAAFTARRTVLCQPEAERAAQMEEAREFEHQRVLAEKRREKELLEASMKLLELKHKLEAAEAFKDDKFDLGRARFAEKTAKHGVGEAVARASMQEEPSETEKPKPAPLIDAITQHLDAVEKQIDETEASGAPTENLRREMEVLTMMLRREVKKAR